MQGPTSFKQLEAFRAVMLTGTTVQAAEMLHITQPAVSRYLRDLELGIGFALFERRHGRLHPTQEGEIFFNEVQATFAGLGRLQRVAEDIRLMRRGHLRLVVPLPLARGLMPSVIAEFRADHPDITVTMDVATRRELKNRVDAQQFDLAFAALPFDHAKEDIEPLVTVSGVCVLPPGHALASRKVIHTKDLADETFISQLPLTRARFEIDGVFESASIQRNMTIETTTASSICDFIAVGLGVSIVDPFTASASAALGIHIRPFRPAIPYEFAILHPAQRPSAQYVKTITGLIRKRAGEFRNGRKGR